ncbi:putative glucose-6-phosphate 1-epimerase [Phalaenopsis equestris]|uniref:putative glucose-6-phosphate 1-epimerase n=1 Tax=Phalaenopsis equestris TaxID=78828 RepID=UPI0009E44616|nr:putative glucose-6-phosphate 1-epimerase [Phalaenopsis equestris]
MATEKPLVERCRGINGMEKVVLTESRGCSVEVYLYGAHVTSWKNNRGEEMLFVSSKAVFNPPDAIQGGIPICFPQFGRLGKLKPHGFARNRLWAIDENPPPLPESNNYRAFVDLILKPHEEKFRFWPYSYEFRLRVALTPGGDIIHIARIRNLNRDGKSFSFTFGFHNYFSISDICEVRIEGLETSYYLDNLKGEQLFTEQGNSLTFESEVDKMYLNTPNSIAIRDHQKRRTYIVRKTGLPDTAVWNPWDKKAKAMSDFGNDEYKRMVCVEAAIIEHPFTLKAGEEWTGTQQLSVIPYS